MLVGALVLLLWCAAMRLASVEHPELTAHASSYYPDGVLPELLVAWLWAVPMLAARVALGRSYGAWLQKQRQQKQQGGHGVAGLGSAAAAERGSVEGTDAEAQIGAARVAK